MYNWYEVKVAYDKLLDNGLTKKVPETYIVDAFNISEAEKRVSDELRPFMRGEFETTDVKRAKIAEVFDPGQIEDYRWYKLKLTFVTVDESKGKEKKTSNFVLVKASDIKGALAGLEEGMKGSVMDYTITSVVETAIMEVLKQ